MMHDYDLSHELGGYIDMSIKNAQNYGQTREYAMAVLEKK